MQGKGKTCLSATSFMRLLFFSHFSFLMQKSEALGIYKHLDATTHTYTHHMDWCCCVLGLLRTQQKPRPPVWSHVQGMTSLSGAPLSSALRMGRRGTDLRTDGAHTRDAGERARTGTKTRPWELPRCTSACSPVSHWWVWRPAVPFFMPQGCI